MQTFIKFGLPVLSILIISNLHIDDNRKYSIVQNPQNQSGNSIEGAAVNAKNQKEFLDTNANWMAAIQQNISQQEYHIHYDSVENAYQCPNRKNNIRSYFRPGEFSMQNRKDSTGYGWKLTLINKGIYTNGILLEMPENEAMVFNDENEINLKHKHFTEQYINSEQGVRQNFIVDSVPANTQEIKIKISTDGLQIEKANAKELHFFRECDGVDEQIITYSDLKVWDVNQRSLDAYFEMENNGFSIVVNVQNAQFPVTIDPISTTAGIQLESNQANSNFGYPVSSAGDVNGDGYSDVIVGAFAYDNGQFDEGAAFIYQGSANGISTTAAIMLESNQLAARFGISVASAGDVNGDGYSDVLVGAAYYDNGESDEGAVFIYHGSAAGINAIANTQIESNQVSAYFGGSVATAGDVNRDGFSDIIVGAYGYDNGQTNEGVVFIYRGTVTGISTVSTIQIECNQASAQFGISVASAGDINADGYSDIIIGANLYDNGQLNEGAVFIYIGSSSGIDTANVILLESNKTMSNFGYSVASAGDVNGDGYSDLIVGAYAYENGEGGEGLAFIYHGSSAGIGTAASTILESNQDFAYFGISVASAGDINGDGYSDVIVGSYNFDNGETDEGAAFIYNGSASGINTTATAQLESNQNMAFLGMSVASAGDVNGDGYSDVIVGAYNYDNGESNEGAAFVYHGAAEGIGKTAYVQIESNKGSAHLGNSVAGAGDVNGDGYSDIIVAASNYDNGQYSEGVVFVYHGSANGIGMVPATLLELNIAFLGFGSTIASAGDVNGDGYTDVIISAVAYENGESNEGAIFIFHGSTIGLNTVPAAMVESNQANSEFGNAVAGAGDVNGDGYADVIVGADFYDNGETTEGVTFIYYGSSSGINSAAPIMIESNQAYSEFGNAVAGAGDVNGDGYADVIVGARLYDNGETNEGVAHIYYGSASGVNIGVFTRIEVNQMIAGFGYSVSSAGDVNGDGYADVIVGAYLYDNGEANEGAAFVFHGSSVGINTTPAAIIESNQISAFYGISVASAGDVNGDGYADVIVGAYRYDNGQTDEGVSFVYHGAASGLNTTAAALLECNQVSSYFGATVASAGDVNGDGFSDVIIGAKYYDNGQIDEGAFFLYSGNGGKGLRNNMRLYNSDLSTIINQSNLIDNKFGTGIMAKSFLGYNKGKLVIVAKPDGQGFSTAANGTITNSVQFNSAQTAYTNLILSGAELKRLVIKVASLSTKVRVRVKYSPVLAITGQMYGPWRYMPAYLSGAGTHNSVPLPVELLYFNAEVNEQKKVDVSWATASELKNDHFVVQRSKDALNWETLTEQAGAGNSNILKYYETRDDSPYDGISYYRLKQVDINGMYTFSSIVGVRIDEDKRFSVYPNPVKDICVVEMKEYSDINLLELYDASGTMVKSVSPPKNGTVYMDMSSLTAGIYYLFSDNKVLLTKLVKQ